MAIYRIVDMYRERKAVNGIHYDPCGNPIRAYRVDKRHSLLFGFIHYWDYGAYNLCPEYSFYSVAEAEEAILKAENFPIKNKRVEIKHNGYSVNSYYYICPHCGKRSTINIEEFEEFSS